MSARLSCMSRSVEFGRYADSGGLAITLVEPSGEPYAVATVNLAPYGSRPLAYDEVWLKTWGGQDKIPLALAADGILTLTGETMIGDGAHPSAVAQLGKLTSIAMQVVAHQELGH